MRIGLAGDLTPVLAVCSGAGAVITAAGQVTTELLGVPLPAVMAAMAGALLARAYLPSVGFFNALARVTGWVILGCAFAPLAQAIAAKLLGNALPAGVQAGLAAIVAAAEAWPLLIAWVRQEFPALAARIFGAKGGGNGSS